MTSHDKSAGQMSNPMHSSKYGSFAEFGSSETSTDPIRLNPSYCKADYAPTCRFSTVPDPCSRPDAFASAKDSHGLPAQDTFVQNLFTDSELQQFSDGRLELNNLAGLGDFHSFPNHPAGCDYRHFGNSAGQNACNTLGNIGALSEYHGMETLAGYTGNSSLNGSNVSSGFQSYYNAHFRNEQDGVGCLNTVDGHDGGTIPRTREMHDSLGNNVTYHGREANFSTIAFSPLVGSDSFGSSIDNVHHLSSKVVIDRAQVCHHPTSHPNILLQPTPCIHDGTNAIKTIEPLARANMASPDHGRFHVASQDNDAAFNAFENLDRASVIHEDAATGMCSDHGFLHDSSKAHRLSPEFALPPLDCNSDSDYDDSLQKRRKKGKKKTMKKRMAAKVQVNIETGTSNRCNAPPKSVNTAVNPNATNTSKKNATISKASVSATPTPAPFVPSPVAPEPPALNRKRKAAESPDNPIDLQPKRHKVVSDYHSIKIENHIQNAQDLQDNNDIYGDGDDNDAWEDEVRPTPLSSKKRRTAKIRKDRAPRPPLFKWTDEDWKLCVVCLVAACGLENIKIPFERVAKMISQTLTAGALQQALLKLKDKLIAADRAVPAMTMSWGTKKTQQTGSPAPVQVQRHQIIYRERPRVPGVDQEAQVNIIKLDIGTKPTDDRLIPAEPSSTMEPAMTLDGTEQQLIPVQTNEMATLQDTMAMAMSRRDHRPVSMLGPTIPRLAPRLSTSGCSAGMACAYSGYDTPSAQDIGEVYAAEAVGSGVGSGSQPMGRQGPGAGSGVARHGGVEPGAIVEAALPNPPKPNLLEAPDLVNAQEEGSLMGSFFRDAFQDLMTARDGEE